MAMKLTASASVVSITSLDEGTLAPSTEASREGKKVTGLNIALKGQVERSQRS